MAPTPSELLPPSSQQSSSGLSEPPDSMDEEFGEITVSISKPKVVFPDSRTASSTNANRSAPNHNNLDDDDDDSGQATMALKKGNPTSPPPQRKSNRTKRPPRYSMNDSDDEFAVQSAVSPTVTKQKAPGKRRSIDGANEHGDDDATYGARAPPAKKPRIINRTKKWDPDNVTQNSKSPLVNVDLRSLLLQPAAWDCLTAEDKQEILALFPADTDVTHILDAGTPDARPNMEALLNDNNFRHDAEQYVTNLSKGMHDPVWLKDAWAAHHRRAAGEFDAYYIRKIELDWNTTIPDEFKPEHLRKKQNGDGGNAEHSSLNGYNGVASPKENGTTKDDDKAVGTNGDGGVTGEEVQKEEVTPNNGTTQPSSSPIPGQSILDAAKEAQTEPSDSNHGSLTPKSPEDRTRPVDGEEEKAGINESNTRDVLKEAVR